VRASFSPARPARRVLTVQPLEGRITPTARLTATLAATGVLTIVGDDDDSGFTLRVNAGNVVLTPTDTGTEINNADPGDPVTLTGTVTSMKVDLKGGADTFLIDGTVPFTVPGAVAVVLGDGDNTLDFTTTGKIELGTLAVTGGDGSDTVTVVAGDGTASRVVGAAAFTYGPGGSTTTLAEVAFGSTIKVTAGDAVGIPNTIDATDVTTAKAVTANLGNSFPALVSFTGSTVAGLTVSGNAVGASLVSSAVNGNVTLKGVYQADLQAEAATVTGSVALTAALASFAAAEAGTTINGNLTLTGSGWTTASFQTTTLSEVKGSVTVKGGWFNDTFETNALFKVGKNLGLSLGGGDNTVSIGDGSAAVAVGGNAKVTAGAGADSVSFDRVAVTGTTGVTTLSGRDYLSIENGSTFTKAFTADLGTGDDEISIAQLTGSAAAVTFGAKSKIGAGTGNDVLMLGLENSVAAGGDANSRAAFMGTGHVLDGGLGLNFYDAASGQSSGVTPTGW
jgi:hypothetical protein